ncbi:MAG TPA: (2Fe-2S)-binding protein [Fimbriimonadaceae bacterium]|mgnify:CR=1 FL=1|nr:(2Fe-2S)-binding protein [Fimbriimonadaceae bacterium]
MNPEKPVTFCVCHKTSFADLKAAKVTSLEDIANRFGCGTGCGSCKPYLVRLLETGETEFDVIESSYS